MNNELPRRGGAHTFEQLEAEVIGAPAANQVTQAADRSGPKEPAPKAPENTSSSK